eukprot:4431844-Lingulodinium_polyedra.AAC.1
MTTDSRMRVCLCVRKNKFARSVFRICHPCVKQAEQRVTLTSGIMTCCAVSPAFGRASCTAARA